MKREKKEEIWYSPKKKKLLHQQIITQKQSDTQEQVTFQQYDFDAIFKIVFISVTILAKNNGYHVLTGLASSYFAVYK